MLLSSQRNTINKKITIALSLFFVMGAIFLLPNFVSAQELDAYGGGTPGVNEATLQEATGLGSTDPRIVVARVIQIALGFLAIIAVSLVIYGGWMYMTSEGNEEKIEKAKKILKNAVIGLIIILASFGIVSFILSRLIGGSTYGGLGSQGGPGFRSGFGAIGSCSVESVFPEDLAPEVPRNTAIIVTFKEEIDPSTVCKVLSKKKDAGGVDIPDSIETCRGSDIQENTDSLKNVKIYMRDPAESCRLDSDPDTCINDISVDAKVYTNDNKTFTFIPNEYLGSASDYIWYEVYMTNDIRLTTGAGVFDKCRENLNWKFEVSNKLDLEPPMVTTVFPGIDNWSDEYQYNLDAAATATASIVVNNTPQVEVAAWNSEPVTNPVGAEFPGVEILGIFSCSGDDCPAEGKLFVSVSVQADGSASSTVEGKNSSNEVISISCITEEAKIYNKKALLGCGLDLDIKNKNNDNFSQGNSWVIEFRKAQTADTLTVGGTEYTFVSSDSENISITEIKASSTNAKTAQEIATKLDARSDMKATVSANKINLEARKAGSEQNNIGLTTTSDVLDITSFSGGVDKAREDIVYGRKDKPRNAIIQINFNEAMLPMAVSGNSDQVKDYIKVVNADISAKSSGGCDSNSDCKSFNCFDGSCQNDYLAGNFEISNGYKTVEFIPATPCEGEAGVNACGGRVYCLPSEANLKIELDASSLVATCNGNTDCETRNPYKNCTGGICQDSKTPPRNYPLGDPVTGIGDACSNSLDGDRNKNAEGPDPNNPFNENDFYGSCGTGGTGSICTGSIGNLDYLPISSLSCDSGSCLGSEDISNLQTGQGDNYTWSFYTSDQILSGAPTINSVNPNIGDANVNLSDPIRVSFKEPLLMASTLRTGGIQTLDPVTGDPVPHRRVNLWNYTSSALGYWVTKEDVDESPADNEPESTRVFIKHSMFDDAATYRVQLGSGIYDIYQNCYLPSDGPACSGITKENPSCCNGVVTSTLDGQGSCQ